MAMMTNEQIVDAEREAQVQDFMAYLEAKGCQLWDGPGMLTDPAGRRAAAEWFLGQLSAFRAYQRATVVIPPSLTATG